MMRTVADFMEALVPELRSVDMGDTHLTIRTPHGDCRVARLGWDIAPGLEEYEDGIVVIVVGCE